MDKIHAKNEDLIFFSSDHLPISLRPIVESFAELAEFIDQNIPENSQRKLALQKLIEAKDCTVRAILLGKHQD